LDLIFVRGWSAEALYVSHVKAKEINRSLTAFVSSADVEKSLFTSFESTTWFTYYLIESWEIDCELVLKKHR